MRHVPVLVVTAFLLPACYDFSLQPPQDAGETGDTGLDTSSQPPPDGSLQPPKDAGETGDTGFDSSFQPPPHAAGEGGSTGAAWGASGSGADGGGAGETTGRDAAVDASVDAGMDARIDSGDAPDHSDSGGMAGGGGSGGDGTGATGGSGGSGGSDGSGGTGGSGGYPGLSVMYMRSDADIKWLRPEFVILNRSPADVPISELKLRYYYTVDGDSTDQSFECWLPNEPADCSAGFCCDDHIVGSIVPTSGTDVDHYLELGFLGGAHIPAGGQTDEIAVGIHKDSWADFDLSNDYSHTPFTEFTETDRITLYRNGSRAWGIEP